MTYQPRDAAKSSISKDCMKTACPGALPESHIGTRDVSTRRHGRNLGEWSMRRQRMLAQTTATAMSSYSAISAIRIRKQQSDAAPWSTTTCREQQGQLLARMQYMENLSTLANSCPPPGRDHPRAVADPD